MSGQHFGEFVSCLDGLKKHASIESYDVVFLAPHGGDATLDGVDPAVGIRTRPGPVLYKVSGDRRGDPGRGWSTPTPDDPHRTRVTTTVRLHPRTCNRQKYTPLDSQEPAPSGRSHSIA